MGSEFQSESGALGIRLKAAGYEAQVIRDGLSTYIQAMANPPDLILMDMYIPKGSGLDVAAKLKHVGLGGIPVIFMTASKQNFLRERAEELNAVGFLEKPFDTEELLAVISRALQPRPTPNERTTK